MKKNHLTISNTNKNKKPCHQRSNYEKDEKLLENQNNNNHNYKVQIQPSPNDSFDGLPTELTNDIDNRWVWSDQRYLVLYSVSCIGTMALIQETLQYSQPNNIKCIVYICFFFFEIAFGKYLKDACTIIIFCTLLLCQYL